MPEYTLLQPQISRLSAAFDRFQALWERSQRGGGAGLSSSNGDMGLSDDEDEYVQMLHLSSDNEQSAALRTAGDAIAESSARMARMISTLRNPSRSPLSLRRTADEETSSAKLLGNVDYNRYVQERCFVMEAVRMRNKPEFAALKPQIDELESKFKQLEDLILVQKEDTPAFTPSQHAGRRHVSGTLATVAPVITVSLFATVLASVLSG
jgi:hypothetical protein